MNLVAEILVQRTAERCRDISRWLSPRSGRNHRKTVSIENRTLKGWEDFLPPFQGAIAGGFYQPGVAFAALTYPRLISMHPFGVLN